MKYLRHDLESELILMRDYKLNPNELLAVKVILLAQDEEYKYIQEYNDILNGGLRLILETLQSKGIILKSYKLPKAGTVLDPSSIPFNQNFLKRYYRSAFELGEELFDHFPQTITISGVMYNARRVSKKFDSLEQAFAKYAKYIKNNPETHNHIIELIEWGKENQYNFTTLDSFIVDMGWKAIEAQRNGEGSNINLEATQLI